MVGVTSSGVGVTSSGLGVSSSALGVSSSGFVSSVDCGTSTFTSSRGGLITSLFTSSFVSTPGVSLTDSDSIIVSSFGASVAFESGFEISVSGVITELSWTSGFTSSVTDSFVVVCSNGVTSVSSSASKE